MKKVYIWPFALRISHFIMIISFFFLGLARVLFMLFFGLLFVLVMLGISVFLVVLGYLASGSEEGVGYFAFMLENYSSFAWIKDAHKMLANAILAIACLHICGAFLDCVLNKAAASKSMINGYKNSYENVELHKFHRLLVPFGCL